MITEQQLEYYLDGCEPQAIRFHELDDAIIGVDHNSQLCYSYTLMLDIFMERDGMSQEEAMEWIDYNVLGTYAGVGFTVVFDE